MQAIRLLTLGFSILLLFTACSKQEKSSKKSALSETKLYKVDKDIAASKMIFDSNVKMNCLVVSVKEDLRSKNPNPYLEKIFKEEAAVCSLYQAAEQSVSKTFQKIEDAGSVGDELYFFKILVKGFDDKENPIHNEEPIGFFESYKDCEKYRDVAIKLDIPNKSCKKLTGNPMLEFFR
jgi:c-di-AMP phosphodiesterase-like protein